MPLKFLSARKVARRLWSKYRPLFEQLEFRELLAAVANAGVDQDVYRGNVYALDGTGSTGNGSLTYTWTQKSGPDVTGGLGTLSGATPGFVSPGRVATIEFDLVVSDADGVSNPDRVVIAVLEDADNALFVSPSGSDANPGTRTQPL